MLSMGIVVFSLFSLLIWTLPAAMSGQRKGAVELITEGSDVPACFAAAVSSATAQEVRCLHWQVRGWEGFLTMLIASSAGPKHMGGKIHG
jgi:hypothetical protein